MPIIVGIPPGVRARAEVMVISAKRTVRVVGIGVVVETARDAGAGRPPVREHVVKFDEIDAAWKLQVTIAIGRIARLCDLFIGRNAKPARNPAVALVLVKFGDPQRHFGQIDFL